jgi:hypothetical protein
MEQTPTVVMRRLVAAPTQWDLRPQTVPLTRAATRLQLILAHAFFQSDKVF